MARLTAEQLETRKREAGREVMLRESVQSVEQAIAHLRNALNTPARWDEHIALAVGSIEEAQDYMAEFRRDERA